MTVHDEPTPAQQAQDILTSEALYELATRGKDIWWALAEEAARSADEMRELFGELDAARAELEAMRPRLLDYASRAGYRMAQTHHMASLPREADSPEDR